MRPTTARADESSNGRVCFVPSTETSMVPDDTLSIRDRAIAAWPPAWHGQNLRDIAVTLGFDVDKPWRQLSRKIIVDVAGEILQLKETINTMVD